MFIIKILAIQCYIIIHIVRHFLKMSTFLARESHTCCLLSRGYYISRVKRIGISLPFVCVCGVCVCGVVCVCVCVRVRVCVCGVCVRVRVCVVCVRVRVCVWCVCMYVYVCLCCTFMLVSVHVRVHLYVAYLMREYVLYQV